MLEVLVLKNATECTSQRLKRTSGARVMTFVVVVVVVGCWLVVVGCWLLVVGCLLFLVVGCWLVLIAC